MKITRQQLRELILEVIEDIGAPLDGERFYVTRRSVGRGISGRPIFKFYVAERGSYGDAAGPFDDPQSAQETIDSGNLESELATIRTMPPGMQR